MEMDSISSKIKQEIIEKMSPQEKWNEVLRLRETAWQLKVAFLKAQNPNWTDEQIKEKVKKIFLYATT